MTLSMNGTVIGKIISIEPTRSTYVCAPDTPSNTPIPAYKVGTSSLTLTIKFKATTTAGGLSLFNTIDQLVCNEAVVYLSDDQYRWIDDQQGFWAVIGSVKMTLVAKDVPQFEIAATMTTDHDSSTYTPP